MARSLNRVQLIGNLTRDPELRYTPSGKAVSSFGLATNRTWTTETGEKHEEAEFHNIVAWSKLAEICSQFLIKGRKVYVEGRLSTRSWSAQDGTQRNRTEVVIDDMILLDSKRIGDENRIEEIPVDPDHPDQIGDQSGVEQNLSKDQSLKQTKSAKAGAKEEKEVVEPRSNRGQPTAAEADVNPDDIPF